MHNTEKKKKKYQYHIFNTFTYTTLNTSLVVYIALFPALKTRLQHWDSVQSNISSVTTSIISTGKSVFVFTVTLAGGASGYPALAQYS